MTILAIHCENGNFPVSIVGLLTKNYKIWYFLILGVKVDGLHEMKQRKCNDYIPVFICQFVFISRMSPSPHIVCYGRNLVLISHWNRQEFASMTLLCHCNSVFAWFWCSTPQLNFVTENLPSRNWLKRLVNFMLAKPARRFQRMVTNTTAKTPEQETHWQKEKKAYNLHILFHFFKPYISVPGTRKYTKFVNFS